MGGLSGGQLQHSRALAPSVAIRESREVSPVRRASATTGSPFSEPVAHTFGAAGTGLDKGV